MPKRTWGCISSSRLGNSFTSSSGYDVIVNHYKSGHNIDRVSHVMIYRAYGQWQWTERFVNRGRRVTHLNVKSVSIGSENEFYLRRRRAITSTYVDLFSIWPLETNINGIAIQSEHYTLNNPLRSQMLSAKFRHRCICIDCYTLPARWL